MTLSLQRNVQKAVWAEKKEVLRFAREQLLGQHEAEAAKQARADERQAAEFIWRKPKPFRR